MRLLKIGQLAIHLILSKNAASQTDLLFKKVVPFDTLSMNGFVFWKDTTLLTIQEIQFIKCSLIVPNLDSVIGYWGIRNDTIYYISDKSYRNDCTEFMPMIQLKEAKPKIWSVMENECSGYNKSIDFFRFSYSTRLLSKTSFNNLAIPLWALFVRVSGLPKFILPSPADVWTRFLKALTDGSLLYHTGVTLVEVTLGLLAGVCFATVVGYLLAKSRTLESVLSPYLVASQAIPIVAIAPLLVIWLGDGILSKVVICALIVFFPVLVNTIVGVRAVSASLYDLMNSHRATRWQILWKLELPASLPVLLGGLRIGATLSVIGGSRRRIGRCRTGAWLSPATRRFSIRHEPLFSCPPPTVFICAGSRRSPR